MRGASEQRPLIEGYEVGEVIGSGGMGTVYRARELALDRDVAIKVLAEAFRGQAGFVDRFRREAQMQATLQHPHVVPVYASGESNHAPYIVMRLVEGPSLRQLLQEGRIEVAYLIGLLDGIASALDSAHERGILHLDVKPHNVLIERGEHPWLADFGLTRLLEEASGLTMTGGLVGSFDYLAPEIALGEPATPRSDLYSLGATAFQALTGVLPFPATHQAAALFAHASAPRPSASAVRPALARAIDPVLKRCLAIDPAERFGSATEFVDALRFAAGLPSRTRSPVAVTELGSMDGIEAHPEASSWADTLTPLGFGPRARGSRRLTVSAAAIIASAAVAMATLIISEAPSARLRTVPEVVGGQAHTWSNYQDADGQNGPLIPAHRTVRIACRLRGYKVTDGNRWWYRIASSPWNDQFYVSADAFYNDGRSTGSLRGTPFVDLRVPTC